MKVGVTFNLKAVSPEPVVVPAVSHSPAGRTMAAHAAAAAPDTYAEWDDEATIDAVVCALAEPGHTVMRLPADAALPRALDAARPDLVFNIAEGFGARSREAQVPALCEMLGIPHSGSDAVTLGICLDKAHTKEILAYHGIPTPPFVVAHAPEQVTAVPFGLPAFVKPVHEGSSKGIFASSHCATLDAVRAEVARVVARYHQPALIEAYLPGREFTVALLGNGDDVRVLPIVEYNFAALPAAAPRIDSYEAKWIYDRPDRPLDALRCPADVPGALADAIGAMCRRAYAVLRIHDWARMDVRCDAAGTPYLLEVNPLPGILPDPADNSCFPAAARAAGLSYNRLLQTVLDLAAARAGLA